MTKRFLAHAAVYDRCACKNAFVEISGDEVTVSPFERETHSTVFVPGIMYIIKGELSDCERNDLAAQVKASGSVDNALTVLLDYDSVRSIDAWGDAHYYIFSL